MRQYGLEVETKDGKPLDYRTMDWPKTDIRNYEVVQPPGRKSVLGVVKFSFPSQHTIFMHDTPDKWMFNSAQRTLSHGCLGLRNPVRMAELILAEDKGWDAGKIAELIRSGPLNNEVVMDKKIRMHIYLLHAVGGRCGGAQVLRGYLRPREARRCRRSPASGTRSTRAAIIWRPSSPMWGSRPSRSRRRRRGDRRAQ